MILNDILEKIQDHQLIRLEVIHEDPACNFNVKSCYLYSYFLQYSIESIRFENVATPIQSINVWGRTKKTLKQETVMIIGIKEDNNG